jgi:hypothetical protein
MATIWIFTTVNTSDGKFLYEGECQQGHKYLAIIIVSYLSMYALFNGISD